MRFQTILLFTSCVFISNQYRGPDPPPPTWKIQYYLFNIVNEEMGPDPIPLENLNFKIKLLKVCLGPPDPASTIILRTPYPLKIMDPRKFQKVHLLPKMSFYTAIIIFKL